jgi:hypothetical protein
MDNAVSSRRPGDAAGGATRSEKPMTNRTVSGSHGGRRFLLACRGQLRAARQSLGRRSVGLRLRVRRWRAWYLGTRLGQSAPAAVQATCAVAVAWLAAAFSLIGAPAVLLMPMTLVVTALALFWLDRPG